MLSIIFPYIYFLCTFTVRENGICRKRAGNQLQQNVCLYQIDLFLKSKILLVLKQSFSGCIWRVRPAHTVTYQISQNSIQHIQKEAQPNAADNTGAHNHLYSISLTLSRFASTDSPVIEPFGVECYLCPTMPAWLSQRLKQLGNSQGLRYTQMCLYKKF